MSELSDRLGDLVREPQNVASLQPQEAGRLLPVATALVLALAARAAEAPSRDAGQAAPTGVELRAEQVADRINRRVGYVRELLRRRDLPGFRRGKYWVIPEADLLEWQASRNGIDKAGSLTLPSSCDPGRASHHPKAAWPYTVEVRRPARGSSGKRQEVGDGSLGYEEHH